MAQIGSSDGVNTDLVYMNSFGNLPNGTVYMHVPAVPVEEAKARTVTPWGTEEIKSVLTSTSPLMATGTQYSATSGSIPVLLPTFVDSQLYDLTRRDTPLASGLLARVTNRGIFADIVKRTVLPTAKFKPEGSALTSDVATYTRAARKMSFLYATGEVSGPMIIASQVWQSALQLETEAHFRALKEMEENCIINGNPTSSTVDGGVTDENAFSGFVALITTNTLNKSAATITLANIRDAIRTIREAKGHPNLIVTDYKTLDDVKALIQDQLRYPNPGVQIAWGIQAIEFEGIPMIPDLFMSTTASSREMYVLDTVTQNNIQIRVLQDATLEELAKTGDSYKFTIKEYITLVIAQEAWCYRIYGLA